MPFLGLLYYSFFIFILISFSSPSVEASPRVSPPLLPFPILLLPLSYLFISDSAPFILFTSFYFSFDLFLNLFFDSAIIPFSHFLHPPCTPFFSSSYLFLRLCILFELLAQSSVASRVFFSLFVLLKRSRIQSDSRALCIRRLSRTAAVLCCRGDVDRSAAGHKDTRPEIIFSFVSVSRLLLYRGKRE